MCVPLARGGVCWAGGGRRPEPVKSASGPRTQALWTKDGSAVVYPCHAVVVVLRTDTREQRCLLGHTDKVGATGPAAGGSCPWAQAVPSRCRLLQVSALALDGDNVLLASAQARPSSMLRLWDFRTGACLSLFRSPAHMLCSLRWAWGL